MNTIIFIVLFTLLLIVAWLNKDIEIEFEEQSWEDYKAELARREDVMERVYKLRAKADKIEREEL